MSEKKFQQVIIHFGSDKTGSTSIQRALFQNKELLERHGVYYPLTHWHQRIASYVSTDPTVEITNIAEGPAEVQYLKERDKEYMSMFHTYLENRKGKYLILSYEGFQSLEKNDLEKLKTFAQQYAENVQIVYYIREASSYATSVMSERVKAGFRSCPNNIPIINDYIKIIKKIVSVFGKDNILIRSYHTTKSQNVIYDFLSSLDLPDDILLFLAQTPGDENKSLSMEALLIGEEIINVLESIGITLNRNVFYNTFANALMKIDGTKILLTPIQYNNIKHLSTEQQDYLYHEFVIELPEARYCTDNKVFLEANTIKSIARLMIEFLFTDLPIRSYGSIMHRTIDRLNELEDRLFIDEEKIESIQKQINVTESKYTSSRLLGLETFLLDKIKKNKN